MTQPIHSKTSSSIIVKGGLLVAFAIFALLTAYFTYTRTRNFVLTYDVTEIKGFAFQSNPTNTPNAEGIILTEEPKPTQISGPQPRPWDGASPVTVLVMGLDYGDWSADREGPSRTDTMILFTIDPLSKTAGMLNIPRDLWVNIPGFDYGKINTAFYLGEANNLPEGGPGLAIKTVEQLLGVPINYYAQIDFEAFETFIDKIDGVEIDVPYEIKIDPIGPYNTITLQPGKTRLYGPEALAYARARYTEGGDFDRAQRQQQVILAMRKRILKPEVLYRLISNANEIYAQLSSGIHTNMSLDEAIQFAWLAQQISPDNIRRGAIAPPNQVLFAKSPDGTQDILKPIPDKIREERDYVFGLDSAYNPALQDADLASLMQAEQPRIVVLNGTYTEGLAGRTQEYLITQGAQQVTTGNAGSLFPSSVVVYHTGKPYTVRYLVDLMQISPTNIRFEYDPNSQVDVEITLGENWANTNPMP